MDLLKMFKKKKKTKTVIKNEIDYEKLTDAIVKAQKEIDYDKLAEAIVNAQRRVNEADSSISKTFVVITGMFFYAVSILGGIMAIFIGAYSIWYVVSNFNNDSKVTIGLLILFVVLVVAIILMFTYLLFKCAKEIENEKDKQYIISLFSAVVCFVALILSFVALVSK